MPPSSC